MRVADALDEQTSYDLVIVTLLAHQVDAVLPALRRSAAKRIQFMSNTFDPERLQDAVGSDRCSFGMPFVQATVDAYGKLKATIGASGQKTKMNYPHWVDLFNAAGIPAVLEPDMLLWLRCHTPPASRSKVCLLRVFAVGAALRGLSQWLWRVDCRKACRSFCGSDTGSIHLEKCLCMQAQSGLWRVCFSECPESNLSANYWRLEQESAWP